MIIENTADIISSIDIMERITELQAMKEGELESLRKLAKKCVPKISNWEYGATLIRSTHFTKYCIKQLEVSGQLPVNPSIKINEEETANGMKYDYMSIDFCGVEYLVYDDQR